MPQDADAITQAICMDGLDINASGERGGASVLRISQDSAWRST